MSDILNEQIESLTKGRNEAFRDLLILSEWILENKDSIITDDMTVKEISDHPAMKIAFKVTRAKFFMEHQIQTGVEE